MVLADINLDLAERHALAILDQQTTPPSPVELIKDLQQRGVSDAVARDTIWYLIDRYEIELTWDRRLRRVDHQTARIG